MNIREYRQLRRANITAVSLKPESRGQILWSKNYPAPSSEVTRCISAWDPEVGVFVTTDMETMEHNGWSLADGSHLWGPVSSLYAYDYFNDLLSPFAAYGKLYYSGYGGVVHCWDLKTGEPLWTYGNGGSWQYTQSGLDTSWGLRPLFIHVFADGKLYLFSDEHSPNTPLYKDALVRCLNATDGTEIWTMMGSVGKGPSAMTVEAPKQAIKLGDSLVISGSVTDIASGTKQHEQAARLHYGVPAVLTRAWATGWSMFTCKSHAQWMQLAYQSLSVSLMQTATTET